MEGSSSLAPMARRLEGKVAMITGGASGIGATTARLFIKHGAKVVVCDIQDDLGHSLCRDIGADQPISYVHCDVSRETDVKNAVDAAVAKYGRLDIMFSNAGVTGNFQNMSIMSSDPEDLHKVFSTNVFGGFWCGKHAAAAMAPAKKGSIIFTSSVASVIAGLTPHAYTVSKHALVGLTKSMCAELGQNGIRVNCISPHVINTPLAREGFELSEENADRLIYAAASIKGTPLTAADVAEAALFLGSDDSKYVSGLNVVLDGGYSTTNREFAREMKEMIP